MSMKLKYGALLGLVLVVISGAAVAQPVDGADVWYTYTPDAAGDFTLSLTTAFSGATLAVFNGDTIVNDPAAATPEEHEEYTSPLDLPLDAGVAYYFRVAGVDQGGGAFATGDYTILLDKVVVVEGEGEPVEGEGEPVEGEGETDILGNFDTLDTNGDDLLSLEELAGILTQAEFDALDANGDGRLDKCELGAAAVVTVADAAVEVACDDFDAAHQDIANAFKGVTVNCVSEPLTVSSITAVDSKGAPVEYNLDEIAATIEGFGAYDKSIAKTRELFHKYFLFQGGEFTLTYAAGADAKEQTITLGKECRGCMGCYSCDSCAGRRPIPDNVMNLKRLMSDWLLLGLSVMTLLSLSSLRKS